MNIEQLMPFCRQDSCISKWNGTNKPFNHGIWTYATDGRICVRVPAIELPEPEGKTPDPTKVEGWDATGEWKLLPPIADLETQGECPNDCCENGMEPPFVICEECESEVQIPGELKPCRYCVGGRTLAILDGCKFACTYLAKIHALPGPVEYLILPGKSSNSDSVPILHFRFSGGRGLLMAVFTPGDTFPQASLVKEVGK